MNKYLTYRAKRTHWWDYPVIIMSILMGILTVDVSVEKFTSDDPVISILAFLIVFALMTTPAYRIIRRLLRQRTAAKLAKGLDMSSTEQIPMSALDKRTGVANSMKKLRKLLNDAYLQNVAIDEDRKCIYVGGKPWTEASPTQKAIVRTGNTEFDEKLSDIRKLNDDIKNWKVSSKIDRIEQLTASIFQVINEKPDRADDARRFMNYYLPTTMKLLESYKLMEQQSYQGENIQVSRKKIEDVLDTMIHAMEGQQDKLFKYDVLDVETDITVLDTLMAADGLSEKGSLPRQSH